MYLIAFGLGLAISLILPKHSTHPPAQQNQAPETISRLAEAPTPESAATAARRSSFSVVQTPSVAWISARPSPFQVVRAPSVAESSAASLRPVPNTLENSMSSHPALVPNKGTGRNPTPPPKHTVAKSARPSPSGTVSIHPSQPPNSATAAIPSRPHERRGGSTSGDFAPTGSSAAVPAVAPRPPSKVEPAPDVSELTKAVPRTAERIQGIVAWVSADTMHFALRGIRGISEFLVTPQTTIYAGSERIEFSRMAKFVGILATVWSASGESDRLAGQVVVLAYPPEGRAAGTAIGGNGGPRESHDAGSVGSRGGSVNKH